MRTCLHRCSAVTSAAPVPFFTRHSLQPPRSQRRLPLAIFASLQRPQVRDTFSPFRRFLSSQSRRRQTLPTSAQPQQASYIFTLSATAVAFCLGVLLQEIYTRNWESPDSESRQGLQTRTAEAQKSLDMASEQSQTGYVGNLTDEQEAKLRELWIASLKIFSIAIVEDEVSEVSSRNGSPSTDDLDKKKSKKKFGIFSRKGDSSGDSGEPTSSSNNNLATGVENIKISEADDKYGQSKDFINALATQSPEDLRATFWNIVKHDHPDALLLRFLRARKWDVEKALVMMVSTIQWRLQEMHVDDDIIRNGEAGALKDCTSSDATAKEDGEGFMYQLREGKSFLHGTDKQGRPMCFIRVRLHRQGDQSEASLERFTVHVIETARMMLLPPVETAAIVFDMTDFSLANMDYAPVKFMVKCFEANYPECLGVVLIHKAPWIFSGIWSIIKGWLDPVVAAKIQFTKNVENLEEFIPRHHIPKDLGGDEDFTYEYIEPQPNENAQMENTAKRDELVAERDGIVSEFHNATLAWISAASKNNVENCTKLKKQRNELVTQLSDSYWKLDPFLRARCLYDRQGVIKQNGEIDYYPSKEKADEKTNGAETIVDEKVKNELPRESAADDVD